MVVAAAAVVVAAVAAAVESGSASQSRRSDSSGCRSTGPSWRLPRPKSHREENFNWSGIENKASDVEAENPAEVVRW